jgi:hypothetical protein
VEGLAKNVHSTTLDLTMATAKVSSCIAAIINHHDNISKFVRKIFKYSKEPNSDIITARNDLTANAPELVKLLTESNQSNELGAQLVQSVLSVCQYDDGFAVKMLDALAKHIKTKALVDRINQLASEIYRREILDLAKKQSGFHFNAAHCTHEQVEDFSIESMQEYIKERAPHLDFMLCQVLDAKRSARRVREDEPAEDDGESEQEDDDGESVSGSDTDGDYCPSSDASDCSESDEEEGEEEIAAPQDSLLARPSRKNRAVIRQRRLSSIVSRERV